MTALCFVCIPGRPTPSREGDTYARNRKRAPDEYTPVPAARARSKGASAVSGIRLNKALAAAGVCSRRAADEFIRAGAVSVNGAVITELGTRVDPSRDVVTVHGREIPLEAADGQGDHTYLMLHKPVQVVSTARDPEGRATVLDILPAGYRGKRLYPVGRLDYFSEGLLLLTDDGELTSRLTHPRYHLPKVYEVSLREAPDDKVLETMRKGMTLREGERLAPVEARRKQSDRRTLVLTLHQGVNRQIRRMCRDLNLTILRLCRVALGPLELGALAKGACRPLTEKETAALKRAAGL